MSIILKGINLPKGDTAEVIIRIQPNGEVRDSHGILLDGEAIQIPTPHGRLIDEDDLINELTELQDLNLESIAPTILEAEE